MPQTDQQIANVMFNETRSLRGVNVLRARINIAHAIINAEQGSGVRLRTGPTSARVPTAESATYAQCQLAVRVAREERTRGEDPTGGARNFNFRSSPSRATFFNLPMRTQVGPLLNSYPTRELPANGIYANAYGN